MKSINSFLSAFWSILAVTLVIRVVADKGITSLFIRLEFKTFNSSILSKELLSLSFSESNWEVLCVDVVVDSSEITLVSRLVLDDLIRLSIMISLKGLSSSCWILEAHETIASGGVVCVERQLE